MLKKIILIDNKISLKKDIEEERLSKFYYINPDNNSSVENYLQKKCHEKIKLSNLKKKYGNDFLEQYIDFIGRLSQQYHSLYWWANSLSEKNTFLSDLHKNIYYCFMINNIILKENFPNILIFSENNNINKVIKNFCKQQNFSLEIIGDYNKNDKGSFYTKIIDNTKYFTYFIITEINKKKIAKAKIPKKILKAKSKKEGCYVVRTWFDERTIKTSKDPYFGALLNYLVKKNKSVILLAGILGNYSTLVKKINPIRNENLIIIPENYFSKIRDYFVSIFLAIFLKFKMKTPILFCGIDVSPLVLNEFNKYHPFKVIENILRGIYIKRLASALDIESFLYTFENHSWEKMSIHYLRKVSPKTRILGYQHARVMKSLLNYFPSKYENGLLPLPDKIITVGDHPKRILEKYGSYDDGLILPGCALRYEYLHKNSILTRDFSKKILVPLTISIEESVEIIKFVQEGVKETEYIPIYRCHPVVPFDLIKAKFDNNIKGKYEVSLNNSLIDDLKNCSQLIYTVTTVCMEALMLGLPVIHIDLNEPINGDPLFECDFLRWVVKKPEEISKVLDEIKNQNDEQFISQQKAARDYLKEYFKEVNDENLEVFL